MIDLAGSIPFEVFFDSDESLSRQALKMLMKYLKIPVTYTVWRLHTQIYFIFDDAFYRDCFDWPVCFYLWGAPLIYISGLSSWHINLWISNRKHMQFMYTFQIGLLYMSLIHWVACIWGAYVTEIDHLNPSSIYYNMSPFSRYGVALYTSTNIMLNLGM